MGNVVDANYKQSSLDDLLNDEMMVPVLRSAKLSEEELRGILAETAERRDKILEVGPDT